MARRRKELDLTQGELAEAVGCSPDMVGKVEGGSARPSRQLAELLVARLRAPPDQQSALVQWARTGHREPLSPRGAPAVVVVEPSDRDDMDQSGSANGRAGALGNPYQGLRAFGEKDAPNFFGREALVARLQDSAIAASRCSPVSKRIEARRPATSLPRSSMICVGVHRARLPEEQEVDTFQKAEGSFCRLERKSRMPFPSRS